MKRLTVLILVMGLSLAGSWPVQKIEQAIQPFRTETGSFCTAFKTGLFTWLTAEHCADAEKALIGERVATLVVKDGMISVWQTDGDKIKPIELGGEPKPGDELLDVGYGGGSPKLLFYPGVFTGDMELPDENAKIVLFQTKGGGAIPGMSGGPIINRKGKVVGMIIGGIFPTPIPIGVGVGVPYKDLKAVYKQYSKSDPR